MSKPVKDLIRKELVSRFDGVTSLAVIGFSGLDAVSTHMVRGRLAEKNINMTVVKNSIARNAFKSVGLDPAAGLLEGPCAVAYGADSVVEVVRTLLEVAKEAPKLSVKAALMDGEVFGADRIAELSKYPTRDEAIAKAEGCILSSGNRLAGGLVGPVSKLASILKTIEEKAGEREPEAQTETQPEVEAEARPEAGAEAKHEAEAEAKPE